MSSTEERRRAILELIESQGASNQSELQELLAERGIRADQSQLSRDLRALDVVKRGGSYVRPERVTPLEALASLLRGASTAGPNLAVVRCEPGAASAIARALEAESLDGVMGTVAGDDTVFVAIEESWFGEALRQHVLGLVE